MQFHIVERISGKFFFHIFAQNNLVTNTYVKHGILTKKIAREVYSTEKKIICDHCGFHNHGSNPWLGFSPDRIIIEGGKSAELLEIKCPFEKKKKKHNKWFLSLFEYEKESNHFKTKTFIPWTNSIWYGSFEHT